MIRVVLADDHPLFLDGLDQLLQLSGGFDVVGRCGSGVQVLDAIDRLRPDLLVLDLRMPGLDGLGVLRELRHRKAEVRVVLLTATLDDEDLLEAIRLGVRGAILKDLAPRQMIDCLRKVHAGGRWVETGAEHSALQRGARREQGLREAEEVLTAREIDMVRMVADGLRNRAIAARLGITEATVKSHLSNIYRKLNLQTRVAVRRYAEEKGLL